MNLLTYIIGSSLALGTFYIIYFTLLRKQTHFVANRFYLLFTLIFSMLLPFINIRIPVQNSEAISVFRIKEVVISENNQAFQSIFNLNIIIIILIGLSSSYFLIRLLKQLWLINKLVRANQLRKEGNITIVESDLNESFSFFKYVFIYRHIGNTERQRILLHENAHAQQWHTVDKLISELILALLWFNPFAWFYRIAITETHEYIADQITYKNGIDKLEYQQLLLNQMFRTDRIQFVQYFNQSLIKKRINMMTKNEFKKPLKTRFLIALPLVGIIVMFFAFKASVPEKITGPVNNVLNAIKITEQDTTPKDTSQVFVVVEQNAKFQGGDINTFRNYIMYQVKYPEKARKMGIQGRVIVQFVVDIDGSVTRVKVLRNLETECDAEAVRVIQSSPKWEPGIYKGSKVKQQFVLPIVYKLQNEKK